jgi:iron complex outermembrane receptor protein
MNRLCLALLLGSSLSAPAFAQSQSQTQTQTGVDDANVVVVTGQRPSNEASAGTKTATPLAETPQSVSVVTSSQIVGLGLQNLNQALRYVAGITPETRGSSAEVYDLFKLRGFDAPVYLDGMKMFSSASGYAAPQVDVSRLDRFEVIKGPASVLYGASSPGGLVAQSSKLPIDKDLYGAVAGTYGSYDLYRVDADIGGRAGSDVLWRVYGTANGASTQQKFGKRERQAISAAVTAGAGSSTTFTLLGAYSHDPYNGAYSVFPAVGTLIKNPNGQLPTSFDGGEAGNRFSREQAALTYIFRHDFGGGWALRSSGRYQHVGSKLGLIYTSGAPTASDPTLRTFDRASYSTREQLNNWTFDTSITGSVRTGPVRHELLFGADRQVSHSDEVYAFGTATPLNVYAPIYGTIAVPQTPEAIGGVDTIDTRQRQQGVYGQDQMSLGGLRLVVSGRQDWVHTYQVGSTPRDDQKLTWRVAGLYVTPFGLAPYASYSTSFEPQSATVELSTGGTGPASPSLGKQLELGAKYSVPGTPILLTAAWFRIDQTNVLTSSADFTRSTQTGEVRSQGVEIEGNAPLGHGFTARAAFSRQNVKVTKDLVAARIGKGLVTVGKGGLSANLDWSPTRGSLQGLTIGGGVRHVDSTYADVSAYDGIARNTPAYTLFDALIRYDIERIVPSLHGVTLSINAANLFDKKYLTSCFSNYNWCWYGNRRTVQGTIGYRF